MQILMVAFLSLVLLSCGVRGRPLPPLEPAKIGDGEIKSVLDDEDDNEEDDDEVFQP